MKAVLITGASGGIGEAITKKLAQHQYNLVLVARNENKLKKQCEELSKNYRIRASYIAANLVAPEAAEQIYKATVERGFEVECLINNAGVGSGGEFAELDLQSELNMMQLNLNVLVALTHYFLSDMKKRRKGTVVNVGSMISFMPVPYMAVYGASKAFVRSFTRAIHEECKPYNVNVMLFSPGLTQTNFMVASGLDNATGKALTAGATTQTPEEVAEAFMRGFQQQKSFVVSGRANQIGVKMLAVVPDSVIARQTANSYRKRMGV